MSIIRKLLIVYLVVISAFDAFIGYRVFTPAPQPLGTAISTLTKVVALFETSLASKVTSSATSMTLVSGTDKDGVVLSGKYGFVIDEGASTEEFVICTAATTALTSCSRGVSVTNPNSTVAALQKEHRRGATVKITNHPQLAQLTRLANGDDTYPNRLAYTSHPSFSGTAASTSFASVKYVDDTNNTGAANANDTIQGLVEQATVTEINTAYTGPGGGGAGGTGARLFINPDRLASSSYALQLPSSGQKAALVGSVGTPSATNMYITLQDTASLSFSDAADRVIRADGDSVPSGLWLNLTRLTTTASASGDLIVRNSSAFARMASAGADGYSLISSSSQAFEMSWQPIVRWSPMTTVTSGSGGAIPTNAKAAIVTISGSDGGSRTSKCEVTIFSTGKTTGTCQTAEVNAVDNGSILATWNSGTSKVNVTVGGAFSVACPSTSCVYYFYK